MFMLAPNSLIIIGSRNNQLSIPTNKVISNCESDKNAP